MQGDFLREDQSRSFDDRQRPDLLLQEQCRIIRTERLVLRSPSANDIDALAHLANNFKVAMMLSRMPHPYTVEDAADFVKRTANGAIGKGVYAITKATNGAFLGCCGIEPQADPRGVELGYWLGEPHWNKGFATEAAHAVIDAAFSDGTVSHVDARCRVMNIASRRVIQKCGFQFQGSAMSPSLSLGGFQPVEWYRLDRKTWEALKSWGGER